MYKWHQKKEKKKEKEKKGSSKCVQVKFCFTPVRSYEP